MPCQYKPYPCCNDDIATCESGQWAIAAGTCPTPTCPAMAPKMGDACGCPEATACVYADKTCPTSGNVTRAFCNAGKWQVGTASCANPQPIQCGTATCQPNQVCVRIGTGMDVGCATSPCPMGAIDCSCAHSVCPAAHPICIATDGPFVNCM